MAYARAQGGLWRAFRRRRRAPDGRERGFTLIEMMVALLLLAIVMSASLYAVLQGLQLSDDNNQRVVASGVVSGVLEKLTAQALTPSGFASIPVTTQSLPAQGISGTTYQLTQTTEWVARGVDTSVCNSGQNASLILRATVVATWGQAGQSVTQATLIAPPNGTFSPNDGSLPVVLTSSSGTGFEGATVTAQQVNAQGQPQGQSTSIVTGTDGCAFFAQLPPGTYQISISSAGGVDSTEHSPSVETASVSAGVVSNAVEVSYDTGGTIAWSLSPTTPAPATGMPISIGNSSQGLPDDMYVSTASGSTSGSLSPIFPDGYDIFAGGCTDADPEGVPKPQTGAQSFYDPTTYPNLASIVTVSPGGSATATVPLYPLSLSVVSAATGQPLASASSPSGTGPTAVAGASTLTWGGVCPGGAPTYGLTPVTNGTSATSVGLGHLAISATVVSGGQTYSTASPVNVWVMPDGVYSVNSDGSLGTKYTGPVPVPVQ